MIKMMMTLDNYSGLHLLSLQGRKTEKKGGKRGRKKEKRRRKDKIGRIKKKTKRN